MEIFETDRLSIGTIKNIRKILKSGRFDIVHTHLSHDLWTLVPALRTSGTKLFLTKHMGSYVSKKDILHRYLYKRVTGIFAVSSYVKESLISTCPVEPEKIHLLPDFISISKFDKTLYNKKETKKRMSIPDDVIVVGMAGRISPGKGHEDFINAARIVSKSTNKAVKFVIVGSASFGEEDYEKKVKALAKESGIFNKIIFKNFSNKIPELMNIIDIFVMPSHEESFGIVLLEAMAMELPVIATNNAGAKDIVVNGDTGILIEPKNPELLSGSILDIINHPQKISDFGKNGKKRVGELYSSEKIITQLIDCYNTL